MNYFSIHNKIYKPTVNVNKKSRVIVQNLMWAKRCNDICIYDVNEIESDWYDVLCNMLPKWPQNDV